MAEIPTTLPEITVVDEPLPVANQDTTAAPAVGADTVTSMLNSILRGLFARRILVSLALPRRDDNALENWRANFGYLLSVVVIETIWNLMLVVVSVVILIWSAASKETNVLQFCIWISVYMLQCVVHVVLLWKEYRRRNSTDAVPIQISDYRRWERINTGISYLWSVIGFILMGMGSLYKILLRDAPRLFWLALAFLACSEVFVIFMMSLLCYPILVCCLCLYVMCYEPQEGASENDISTLPKYTFEMSNGKGQNDRAGRSRMIRMETNDPASSNVILTDDVDCRICLGLYENGSELQLLPCKHNFHATCIRKWLRINGVCPICKTKIK